MYMYKSHKDSRRDRSPQRRRPMKSSDRDVAYVKKPKIERKPEKKSTDNAESLYTEKTLKRKNSINSDISTDRSMTSIGKRTSKKKKLKLQNVVKPDGTTELAVVNPGGSLRKKKKNKKRKNAKLNTSNDTITSVGKSNKILFKPAQYKGSTADESGSERSVSCDRKKSGNDACNDPKNNSTKEVIDRIRASIAERERHETGGRITERQRKEQLIEALSVPVQSDKAMKMMRGMGWSGGALGARGNGITEPIMPHIDVRSGAGFGHMNNSSKLGKVTSNFGNVTSNFVNVSSNVLKTGSNTKTVGNWLSESSTTQNEPQNTETDIIVQKTNQLLSKNISFDSLIKTSLTNTNLEFYKPSDFRNDFLKGILELLTSDMTEKTLKYKKPLSKKDKGFFKYATKVLGARRKLSIGGQYQELIDQIMENYSELPGVLVQGSVSSNYREYQLKKVQTFSEDQMKKLNEKQDHKTNSKHWATPIDEKDDDSTKAFINALPSCKSVKADRALKFRVLILLKILYFVKSDDEELEVMFNKVLNPRQKSYVDSTIEIVNSRLRFGGSPAESALQLEIRKYISDTFFGIIFNHQYTSFTVIKYSYTKRPNTSTKDEPKKRRSTAINLDEFNCENSNDVINIEDSDDCDKDNDATDVSNKGNNEVIVKKNDETSHIKDKIEFKFDFKFNHPKTNAANVDADVIKDENTITSIKNNHNETDDKNNNARLKASEITGNGNVVVDNNDNQVVDMKKDIADHKGDGFNVTEKDINNEGTVMDEDDPTEINDTIVKPKTVISVKDTDFPTIEKIVENNGQAIKNTKAGIIVDNDNVGKDNEIFTPKYNKDIDTISIDTMTEDNLLNTEEAADGDFISSDDSIFNCNETNVNEDIVMKEVNAADNIDESLKDISIDAPKDGDLSKPIDSENIIMIDEDIVAYNNEPKGKTVANFNVETDCKCGDKLLNQNIVLSEEHCDNEQLGVSDFGSVLNVKGETKADSRNCEVDTFVKKSEIKNVYLVPVSYPDVKLTKQKAKEIQQCISTNIIKTKELPLLMCHGVQNGALIYTCHTKKSFDWLKNTVSVASDVKVLDTYMVRKMALKFYCLFDFDIRYLFSMIELYNKEISTKEWVVETSEINDDYATFLVTMDEYSINYIHASGLALFAGVDKVEFSLIWD